MSLKSKLRGLVHQALGVGAIVPSVYNYIRGRAIPHRSWHAMLRAHCATNGRFSEWVYPTLKHANPPGPRSDAIGLLGFFSIADQDCIVEHIRKDGYYVFDRLMPEEVCAAIERFARSNPCHAARDTGVDVAPTLYNPENISAQLYRLPEKAAAENPAIQELMADEAFLKIAEAYLQTATCIGGVDSWWSAPFGNHPSDEGAQLFHFDFDAPPRWLKLFVYVTPVDQARGPHVYIKGSHKMGLRQSRALVARGYARISDEDIEQAFGPDAAVEITGPRGTVFIADTLGFHKGKLPTGGDRLLAQLIYCSPVFNNHAPPLSGKVQASPVLQTAAQHHPAAYARFL